MTIAVYAGTFDPFTFGHLSVVKEAVRLFSHVRVLVAVHPTKEPLFDINAITKMLPHRYPFLLVDKILTMDANSIVGVKNVTMNEPQFTGHFPYGVGCVVAQQRGADRRCRGAGDVLCQNIARQVDR